MTGSDPQLSVAIFWLTGRCILVSCRSLNSSRKIEFGASGHCKISTSDVSKIAADRPLSKCDSARSIRSRSRRRSKPDIEIELCCRSVSLQRCTAALGTDGKVCKTAVQTREPRHRHCVLLDAESRSYISASHRAASIL